MRDIDEFLPLVLPRAGNAPEPLVVRCLRDAATRFCERAKLWKCTDTIITAGADAEPISVPSDSVLYLITSCAIDDRPLDPITLAELAKKRPAWRTEDIGCAAASWYVSPERGTIQAVPRASGTLFVEFVAKPSARALTLPDFLLEEYGQDIADGAAGALLLMPNPAFANPQLGAGLSARFQSRLDSLSNDGIRGQQGGRTRTRGRYL
ncbi:MAG TPA: hypothetical protein PLX43_02360 [Nitrobacter sp.]|nr:hypothetical protein [Nitrobacter sp.]